MHKFTIAIDGYSSCGKSTLAKALAKHFDFIFIDSGAMYRAVCLYALENKLLENNTINPELINRLNDIHIQFGDVNEKGVQTVRLNNKDVSTEIREMHVANHVSKIAQIKEVRDYLVDLQRSFQKNEGVVMDGRDIGTVVFPNAEIKLFLTASIEIRTNRRFLELQNNENVPSFESIKANLMERDFMDENRAESPLKKANDALLIDNSEMNQEEQFEFVLNYIKSKTK